MTGLDLIKAALKTLGTLDSTETPKPEESADALDRINDMIDGWATQDLTIYFLLRTTKQLTASTASYTIGTGGAIAIVRPTEITRAGMILDTTLPTPLEVPLAVLTDQQWATITQKTYTSTYPNGLYYDHGWSAGLGLVYPFPIPNQSLTQLVLYTPQALAAMTLAGDVTFPPGYRRLLRYAAAREVSAEYGGWDEAKEHLYNEAMGDVKRKNLRMSDLTMDRAVTGPSRSNIYTGVV